MANGLSLLAVRGVPLNSAKTCLEKNVNEISNINWMNIPIPPNEEVVHVCYFRQFAQELDDGVIESLRVRD
jgi:hypothetical protein